MALQKGRDFMLKVGVGGSPVNVASMRSTGFQVNGTVVDGTTKDSNGIQELIAAAGVTSFSINASGLLAGNAQATDFIAKVVARSIDPYTLVFDNGDKLEGNFQVSSFEAAGEYNGEQTYSLQLTSSGAITPTAAA